MYPYYGSSNHALSVPIYILIRQFDSNLMVYVLFKDMKMTRQFAELKYLSWFLRTPDKMFGNFYWDGIVIVTDGIMMDPEEVTNY